MEMDDLFLRIKVRHFFSNMDWKFSRSGQSCTTSANLVLNVFVTVISECLITGELSFHDDILVYGGDKLAKKTNGKEFREYRVIKLDNGIIIK